MLSDAAIGSVHCGAIERWRRLYPPEIVFAVRSLIENAGLSYREAAARSGLREDTVGRWAHRFGWRRAGSSKVGVTEGHLQRHQQSYSHNFQK